MEDSGLGSKKWLVGMVIVVLLVLLLGSYAGAYPTPAPVAYDLWDISQGITIGNTSGAHNYSDIGYMFGKDYDGTHPVDPTGNLRGLYQATVFRDKHTSDQHFVEWTIADAVTVDHFNLFGYSDTGGLSRRSFNHFILQAKLLSGDSWTTIYSCDIGANQYVETYDADWGGDVYWLSLSASVTTFMKAQYFRAEFREANADWGPRIVELDGFGSAVPIPGAVWLLGSGLLGLWGVRRKFFR